MNKTLKFLAAAFVILVVLFGAVWYLHGHTVAVLSPRGTIAHQQRTLIIIGSLLSLIVVVPVFVMTFWFAWRYRENNHRAHYTPEWDSNRFAEAVWWLVPLLLITVLSVITWVSSHALDPFKPLKAEARPLTIQVVALDWKWLFMYPDQGIATVNYVQFPVNTPINFEITADAPMNSFWIPQLGGQVYAMSGMSTQLHLMASQPGNYRGVSANISGQGFAGMKFTAEVGSAANFDQWVHSVQQVPARLDKQAYATLAAPSENLPPAYYALAEPGLYDSIVMKFMGPAEGTSDGGMHSMHSMEMTQ